MVSKNLPVLTFYTTMNFQSEEGIGHFSLSCLGQHSQERTVQRVGVVPTVAGSKYLKGLWTISTSNLTSPWSPDSHQVEMTGLSIWT